VRRIDGSDRPDADDTRSKLVEAAGEIFAKSGYHAATVRDICARAGTNIALVNYYFGGKLGLYTEVLQQLVRSVHVEPIRSALAGNGAPEDTLRAIVRARMEGLSNRGRADRMFRIFLHELAHPTPALNRMINDVTRPIYRRVLELIGGMIGLPAESEKTRLCAHSIMGQIMLYVLARPVLTRLWPGLKMTPAQLDRIADHIAEFSLAYLQQISGSGTKRRPKGE